MSYQEKYPLDITPQGDTVRDSIQKNRNELLEVAHQVELKSGGGGGGGGLRNRVLSGKTANGIFTFLSGDGLGVAIDGTSIPVIVSFADGFNEFGAVDYVAQITTKTSAWTLPSNKESYLYIQRSSVGAINYDSTTIKPVRQAQPPAAVLNAFYYNTTLEKMYMYNGTEWQNVQCVFVASVTTDATSVKRIEYYQPSMNAGQLADKSITSNKIADGAIKTINIGDKQVTKAKLGDDVSQLIDNVLDKVYPVGSIYCSTISTNPNTLFGFGTWEYIEQGRVLLSQGSNYTAGSTGGEKTHILTVNEMPKHNHTGSTSQDGAHLHSGTTSWSDLQGDFNGVQWINTYANGIITKTTVDHLNRPGGQDPRDIYNFHINASHNHTFTTDKKGEHVHTISEEGGGVAHNIMQPYLSVYMWKRVS